MGQSSTQVNPSVPAPVQGLTSRLENLAGNDKTPVKPYTGSYAAPMTAGENQALNGLRSLAYGSNPLTSKGSQLISDTLTGKYLDPGSNPYLADNANAITSLARKSLGQALDSYDSGSNRAGAYNSTGANNLRRQAFNDSNTATLQALAGLYGNNYSAERSNQLGALSPALSYTQQPFSQLMSLAGLESTPRNIQDVNLQGQYQDFLRTQQEQQYQNELPFNQQLQLLSGYPLSYPQYTPGVSPYQDFSSVAGPLSNLALSYALL